MYLGSLILIINIHPTPKNYSTPSTMTPKQNRVRSLKAENNSSDSKREGLDSIVDE